jgi:hypothetical protein
MRQDKIEVGKIYTNICGSQRKVTAITPNKGYATIVDYEVVKQAPNDRRELGEKSFMTLHSFAYWAYEEVKEEDKIKMNVGFKLRLEPFIGVDFIAVAYQAKSIATKINVAVCYEFNDVRIMVDENTDVNLLHKKYLESKEGQSISD